MDAAAAAAVAAIPLASAAMDEGRVRAGTRIELPPLGDDADADAEEEDAVEKDAAAGAEDDDVGKSEFGIESR